MSIRLSNAYTMGKSSKAAKFVNDTTHINEPAPSQYLPIQKDELSVAIKQPSFSFPKGKDQVKGLKIPGPGEYVIPSKMVEKPQYSMRQKAYTNEDRMKTTTGPGDYSPKVGHKKIQYSMTGHNRSSVNLSQPGPGQYENEHALHYKKISGSKMGLSTRKAEFLQTASTGKPTAAYSLKTFTEDPKAGSAKFSFGKYDRFAMKTIFEPGPGQYDSSQPLIHGKPKYSMPGRRKDLRPKTGSGVPQADQYQPMYQQVQRRSANFSMSKSKRDGELGVFSTTPGCTAYNPNSSQGMIKVKSSSFRIGSERRPRDQQYVPPTPGPGQYDTRTIPSKGRQYSMSSRTNILPKFTPGPGHYESGAKPVQPAAPRFSMGGDKRIMLRASNANPGAGQHNPSVKLAQTSGPKFGFGSSTRDGFKLKETPGPGQYSHIQQVGNANDRSLQNKIQV